MEDEEMEDLWFPNCPHRAGALLRAILSSDKPMSRLTLGVAVLAIVTFGLGISALPQLAAVAAILIGGVVVTTVAERGTRPAARHPSSGFDRYRPMSSA
jgi:hypothetical protein